MYIWDDGIIDKLIHGLYSMTCNDVLKKIDIMQSANIAVIFIWLYVENTFILHHDDVIKWKRFPRNWSFVRGIHRSPVNSPHKGQWRGALMFSLICVWINDWKKQSWRWWFETLSRPLWRHCNDLFIVRLSAQSQCWEMRGKCKYLLRFPRWMQQGKY